MGQKEDILYYKSLKLINGKSKRIVTTEDYDIIQFPTKEQIKPIWKKKCCIVVRDRSITYRKLLKESNQRNIETSTSVQEIEQADSVHKEISQERTVRNNNKPSPLWRGS